MNGGVLLRVQGGEYPLHGVHHSHKNPDVLDFLFSELDAPPHGVAELLEGFVLALSCF